RSYGDWSSDVCSSDLTAQDHLASLKTSAGTALGRLHPDRALALEQDAGDERPGTHLQVGPTHRRAQVGARRVQPPAAMDVAIKCRESLLAIPIYVASQLVARLLGSCK